MFFAISAILILVKMFKLVQIVIRGYSKPMPTSLSFFLSPFLYIAREPSTLDTVRIKNSSVTVHACVKTGCQTAEHPYSVRNAFCPW